MTAQRAGSSAAAAQETIWQELRQIIQERTRTSAAEHKRMIDMGAMIEASKAMLLFRIIAGHCQGSDN
jgi:hypothetical protein